MILLLLAACQPRESAAPEPVAQLVGDGSVMCKWKGSDLDCRFLTVTTNYGQTETRDGSYTDVAIGNFSGCTLDTAGTASCWGSPYGEFDPTQVPAGVWLDIDIEDDSACAVSPEHVLTCWGSDHDKLVSGVPDVAGVVSVSRLGLNSCLLDATGKVHCWGQMANGIEGYVLPPEGTWATLVGQGYNGCVLDADGYPSCFGLESTKVAEQTPTTTRFDRLALGWRHACGLTVDGETVCWGTSSRDQTSPPDKPFVDLAGGDYFTCGMEADETITCWGCANEGECDWEHPLDLPRFGT